MSDPKNESTTAAYPLFPSGRITLEDVFTYITDREVDGREVDELGRVPPGRFADLGDCHHPFSRHTGHIVHAVWDNGRWRYFDR